MKGRAVAAAAGLVLAVAAASALPAGGAAASTPAYRVYVPSMNTDTVQVFDQNGTLTSTVPTGHHPLIAAATPDGRKVFIDDFGIIPGQLTDISASSLAPTKVATDGLPEGVVLSPDGSLLYAAESDFEIQVLSTATDRVVRTLHLPIGFGIPFNLALSQDGRTLFVSFWNSTLGAYDAVTGAVLHQPVATGAYPAFLTLARDGKRLYSLNWGGDDTQVFSTADLSLIKDLHGPSGSHPVIATEDPSGKRLYVTEFGLRDVDVVDLSTWKTVARIPTPGAPMGLSFGPDGKGWITDWQVPGTGPINTYVGTAAFLGVWAGLPGISTGAGDLLEFDPATGKVLRDTKTASTPGFLDFTSTATTPRP